jgi:hypothetical protein
LNLVETFLHRSCWSARTLFSSGVSGQALDTQKELYLLIVIFACAVSDETAFDRTERL